MLTAKQARNAKALTKAFGKDGTKRHVTASGGLGSVEVFINTCHDPKTGRFCGSISGQKVSSRSTRFKGIKDPDGGFTLNTTTLRPLKSGFAVAIGGSDKLLLSSDAFKGGAPSPKMIALVRDRINAARKVNAPPGTKIALGGWHNPADGKLEVNVTVVFPKAQERAAKEFARKNDQIAMFALHSFEVIDTGGTGGSREVS